jgi:hypothetical protein
MTIVLVGLGGIWVGGSLGLVVGGLLANAKSRDLDAAYQRLSVAIHQYLEECAQKDLRQAVSPSHLMALRRVVTEADILAGFEQNEPSDDDETAPCHPPPLTVSEQSSSKAN